MRLLTQETLAFNPDPTNTKAVNDKIEEMSLEYKKSMNEAGKLAMAQAIKIDSIADITEKGWAFWCLLHENCSGDKWN